MVPTIKVSGIEDPQLFAEGSVDYFGYAWLMRYLVSWQYLSPEQMAEWGVALIPTRWSGQKGFILLPPGEDGIKVTVRQWSRYWIKNAI